MTHDIPAPARTVAPAAISSVQQYRGIRYAQPPVGALRFAPPVALPPDSAAPQEAGK